MGPPLEKESISFLASVSKSNAEESPLFSGLLVSGLCLKKLSIKCWSNGWSRSRNLSLVRLSSADHFLPSKKNKKKTEELKQRRGKERERMLPSLIDPFAPPVFVVCRRIKPAL
jgi:hypothetical protein